MPNMAPGELQQGGVQLSPTPAVEPSPTGLVAWRSTSLSPDAQEFLAGWVGGCLGVVAGQPLDTIRIRQQQPPQAQHHARSPQSSPWGHAYYLSTPRPYGAVTARVSMPAGSIGCGSAAVQGPSSKAFLCGPQHGVAAAAQPRLATLQVLRSMIAREGALAPFRGVSYPLCASALSAAMTFQCYGAAMRFLQQGQEPATSGAARGALRWDHVAIAGGFAGAVQPLFMTTVDLLKIRMQLQRAPLGTPEALGPIRMARHVVRAEGLRGLFRGFTITAVRDVPSFAFYFLAYNAASRALSADPCAGAASAAPPTPTPTAPAGFVPPRVDCQGYGSSAITGSSSSLTPLDPLDELHATCNDSGSSNVRGSSSNSNSSSTRAGVTSGSSSQAPPSISPSAAVLLLSGGMAGVASWFGVYPLDVVKSRMQATAHGSVPFSTWLGCAAHTWRHEGLRAFGRGLGATLARAAVVNAATFAGYEWTVASLRAPQ